MTVSKVTRNAGVAVLLAGSIGFVLTPLLMVSWHEEELLPWLARVSLSVAKGGITGSFLGEVCGQVRKAVFTGEVVPSARTSLVLLQQRESGYACVYQFQELPSGTLRGVWHDSEARSGDVVMRKVVDRRPL